MESGIEVLEKRCGAFLANDFVVVFVLVLHTDLIFGKWRFNVLSIRKKETGYFVDSTELAKTI